jgi:membrane-associated protease RseP (regulator of RpoE activity)
MLTLLAAVFLVVTPLLLHEAGHWAVLRRLGVPLEQFWLGLGPSLGRIGRLHFGMLPLGGAVVPRTQEFSRLSPAQRLAVAAAGPLASLVAGLALLLVSPLPPLEAHQQALRGLSVLNFWIAGLNLLPIPPLDGFKILLESLHLLNRPMPAVASARLERLGSGLVYGVGFLVLLKVFF